MNTDTEIQTFRIELRYDFTGTRAEAMADASRRAAETDAEVTDIADANWNTVT